VRSSPAFTLDDQTIHPRPTTSSQARLRWGGFPILRSLGPSAHVPGPLAAQLAPTAHMRDARPIPRDHSPFHPPKLRCARILLSTAHLPQALGSSSSQASGKRRVRVPVPIKPKWSLKGAMPYKPARMGTGADPCPLLAVTRQMTKPNQVLPMVHVPKREVCRALRRMLSPRSRWRPLTHLHPSLL
jgi:hypothetical protein